MAYILHIDTSGSEGTVFLAADGIPVATEVNSNSRDHAAAINTMTEKVLAQAGITLADIDAVAVCGGPGSYTGLRIGLATAKGYCYAADKPLLMHNKLELLANQARIDLLQNNLHTNFSRISTLLIAREQEYFYAAYDLDFSVITEPVHVQEEELKKMPESAVHHTYIIGELSDSLLEFLQHTGSITYKNNILLRPEAWAVLSLEDLKCQRFVSLQSSEPFYLKPVHIAKKL